MGKGAIFMKATVLDLRRSMPEILRALERNEPVTLIHRGKPKGVIYPAAESRNKTLLITEHPAFGMWKNRKDMTDAGEYVRNSRKGRTHAV